MKKQISFFLPLAMILSLSGCWWHTEKSKNSHSALVDTSGVDAEEAKFITHIKSEEQFDKLLQESTNLIVVKIDAPWCSACKDLHPHFVDAAKKGADYIFTRVNVDDLPKIGQRYNVVGIPTLLFIQRGKEIPNSRIEGAEITSGDELLTKIKIFSSTATEPQTVALAEQTIAQS
ncbi:thioredoxin family protein [Candidatus Dependentiae bacterium]|nr:thioredoxin family protein [Candidatus Dependentiae bacterium]